MKSPLSDFGFLQIQRGDFIFLSVLFVCVFIFVAVESVWLVRQMKQTEKKHIHLIWSVIPALVLLVLTWAYRTPSPM
jgi:heme/copper-type cytochrome/quinol oxidase subunit 2